MRRARVLPAALLSCVLLLVGCSGGDEEAAEPAAAPTEAEAPAEPATWPLTGLPVEKGKAEKRHPVLVVKIDNTSAASPQLGLGDADLVVEELVEGGTTRLAAFFYSSLPDVVGPVRSMRTSDIGIVSPAGATVVTSGAAPETIDRVNSARIPFLEEGAAGFFREGSRRAPYNLMARPADVARSITQDAARPEDYFTFGDAADLPQGRKAGTVSAGFGRHTTTWSFANGGYTNAGTFAGQGDEFVADSVLVLRVPVVDAGYTDALGNFVPETRFTGSGQAMLFHDGRMVRGRWVKDGLDSPVRLKARGEDVAVPAGRTWIELVPEETGSVDFQ